MSKNTVSEFEGREARVDPLTELLPGGAQTLVFQAELYACLERHADRRTDEGHAGVVRSGYLPQRELQPGVGPITVNIPKNRRAGDLPVGTGAAVCP